MYALALVALFSTSALAGVEPAAAGAVPSSGPAVAEPGASAAVPVADTAAAPVTAPPAPVLERIAAVVNEDIVTLTEVYELGGEYIAQRVAGEGEGARAPAEGEALERLIERRLVEQEMRSLKLDVTEQDLERTIADIAERNGLDMDALRREVEKGGLRWDQYRSELRESLRDMKFAQSVIRPRVNIREDELRDAWMRTSAGAGSVARLQAIVLALPSGASEADREAVLARAREIRAAANAGADFAELARQHDQGPFGAQGGEMGSFKSGELVEPLNGVVSTGAVGQVSEPMVIGEAVYLVRVAERTTAAGDDFEAQREALSEQVFQQRLESEKSRWYQEARRRAAVRILLPGASGPPAAPAR